jgi:hypothetical protein
MGRPAAARRRRPLADVAGLVHAFDLNRGAGVEEPAKVADDPFFVTLDRNDTLGSALFAVGWLVVPETVQQARQEPLVAIYFSHVN